MPVTDYVQQVLEATVAILDADPDLRVLCARTSAIVIPWGEQVFDHPLPVVVYLPVTASPAWTGVQRLEVQFTVFGMTRAVVNAATLQVHAALTTPAFAARGLDVARDPNALPVRQWPTSDPLLSDVGNARSDISLTFLLPD